LGIRLRGVAVAVLKGDPLAPTVLVELEEDATGSRVRKRAHPVSAALAGGVTPPPARVGHRASPGWEVTTARAICPGVAPTSLACVPVRRNRVAFRGKSARRIFGAFGRPTLRITPLRTRRPRCPAE